jgi:hypothetical protein
MNRAKNPLMFKERIEPTTVPRRRSWYISAVVPGCPFATETPREEDHFVLLESCRLSGMSWLVVRFYDARVTTLLRVRVKC